MADDVVRQLKERGDPWRLGQEAKAGPAAEYVSLRKRTNSALFSAQLNARRWRCKLGYTCSYGFLTVWALTPRHAKEPKPDDVPLHEEKPDVCRRPQLLQGREVDAEWNEGW